MKNSIISYDNIEEKLKNKDISADMAINVLKYIDIVDLMNLKNYPYLNNILLNEKLWTLKIQNIEEKIGFSLDGYIKISKCDNLCEFFNYLYINIITFNKAIELWNLNLSSPNEMIKNIISDILFHISENGFIGLIYEMGYAKSVSSTFEFLELLLYKYVNVPKRLCCNPFRCNHKDRHLNQNIPYTNIWTSHFIHLQNDHYKITKFYKDITLDKYESLCKFLGYSKDMANYLLNYHKDQILDIFVWPGTRYLNLDPTSPLNENNDPYFNYKKEITETLNYIWQKLHNL